MNKKMQHLKTQERKQDTRKKIQLGGLIKKSGLENEQTATLYGMLLESKEMLESADHKIIRQRWKIKGSIAFTCGDAR